MFSLTAVHGIILSTPSCLIYYTRTNIQHNGFAEMTSITRHRERSLCRVCFRGIVFPIADYFDESLDVLAEHVPVQTKNG